MKKNKSAFTLIELLLGLSLFAMISLCLYSSFSSGISLSRRSDRNNKTYREIRWALDQITVDLENSVFYNFANSYPGKMSFVGEEDTITFLLASDRGLKFVRYYLIRPSESDIHQTLIGRTYSKNTDQVVSSTEDDRVSYLIREEIPFLDYLSGDKAKQEKEILSTSVREGSLKFAFGYLQGGNSSQIEWRPRWDKNYTPSGINVTMEFLTPGQKNGILEIEKKILVPAGYWGENES